MHRQDLDSYRTTQARVLRAVDFAPTARMQKRYDFVGPEFAAESECHERGDYTLRPHPHDQAAGFALTDNRKIEAQDLRRAIDGTGGKDRPLVEQVQWDGVVVEESIKQPMVT